MVANIYKTDNTTAKQQPQYIYIRDQRFSQTFLSSNGYVFPLSLLYVPLIEFGESNSPSSSASLFPSNYCFKVSLLSCTIPFKENLCVSFA
jgi:hypothetical protein